MCQPADCRLHPSAASAARDVYASLQDQSNVAGTVSVCAYVNVYVALHVVQG